MATGSEKTAAPADGTRSQDPERHDTYAPPPGPPPNAQVPHHSNETPIPDYQIPYSPNNTQFSAPPNVDGKTQNDSTGHHGYHSAGAKAGLSRLSALGARAASPINMLANKMGSEGFLPSTMDKECEKAARIIRGFCKEGIYADDGQQASTDPKGKRRSKALITIPAKVLQRAVGLAIFTTGRVGFHFSGATGSGVLIARMADGSWSPPSGIQIHSVGAGFMIGADIYDCVLVLNTKEALNAFRDTRLSLGSDLSVVAGPYGAGGNLNIAAPIDSGTRNSSTAADGQHLSPDGKTTVGKDGKKPSPLRQAVSSAAYSYIKSRGVYAGVQVDGTVVTSRQTANAEFYGTQIHVERILRGEVPQGNWSQYGRILIQAIQAAEGQKVQSPSQPQPQGPQGPQGYGQPQGGYYAAQSKPEETWASVAPSTIYQPGMPGYPATQGGAPADPTQYYRGISTDDNEAPPPQSPRPSSTANAKAAEAAAESASNANHSSYSPPPPQYTVEEEQASGTTGTGTLPPAYNENEATGGYGTYTGRH